MYKTAHNLSINYLKRRTKIEFSPIESFIDIQKNDQMVTDLEYSELNNKITELLLEMDNTSRSIFVMRKELGMSIQEIAKNTGKSERTVNRRLKTVIDSLLNELTKSGFITIISLLMAFFSSMIVVYYRGG